MFTPKSNSPCSTHSKRGSSYDNEQIIIMYFCVRFRSLWQFAPQHRRRSLFPRSCDPCSSRLPPEGFLRSFDPMRTPSKLTHSPTRPPTHPPTRPPTHSPIYIFPRYSAFSVSSTLAAFVGFLLQGGNRHPL